MSKKLAENLHHNTGMRYWIKVVLFFIIMVVFAPLFLLYLVIILQKEKEERLIENALKRK